MGSPEYGRLVLDGETLADAGSIESRSLLWSEDGTRLAAQELASWQDDPKTRVVVFDTSRRTRSRRHRRDAGSAFRSDSSPASWCTATSMRQASESCA